MTSEDIKHQFIIIIISTHLHGRKKKEALLDSGQPYTPARQKEKGGFIRQRPAVHTCTYTPARQKEKGGFIRQRPAVHTCTTERKRRMNHTAANSKYLFTTSDYVYIYITLSFFQQRRLYLYNSNFNLVMHLLYWPTSLQISRWQENRCPCAGLATL